jgi:outer membrane protein
MKRIHQLRLVCQVAVISLIALPVSAAEIIGPPTPKPAATTTKLVVNPEPDIKLPEAEALGLKEALRNAYVNNPTLQAARAQLKATHEALPQAMSGWKPTVLSSAGIGHTDIDTDVDDDNTTSKNLGLSLDQPVYRGGRTVAEVGAVRNIIAAQELLLRAREQEILEQVGTIYMDVLRDAALLQLSQNTRDVIARQLEATQDRFDVGELTKTDVSQAQARLARAESDVITVTGNLNASKARFEELVGLPAQGLGKPDIELRVPGTLPEAEVDGDQSSPLVMAAEFAHLASEQDIDGVFGELLPEIGFSSSWNKAYDPSPGFYDHQTTSVAGLTATMPLYEAGSVRSRVREARHIANQRYIEIMETRREVRQEVVSNWADLQAAQAEIRSRKAQVEASTIAQEGVTQETDLGARTILDVLDANQELFDAQVALVTAERNEMVARLALLSTLGSLTPQTLGFPEDAYNYRENYVDTQWKIFDMDVDRVQEVH